MNIIQVVEKLDIGGLEKIVLELSNSFSNNNKVLIITLQEYDHNKINNWISLNKNIEVISLAKKTNSQNKIIGMFNIVNIILKMRKTIKSFKPDVIHTHHIGPLFYSVLSSWLTNINIVHTEHDIWYFSDKKNAFIRKFLLGLKKHKTIALTNEMERELQQFLKTKNTKTIFNGIDIDCLKNIADAKRKLNIKEEFVIGCCGRVEDVKNHSYLIQQARKNKNVRFLIAGDGSLLDNLKKSSPENVTFLGHQNNLSLFFSAIDVFCLPSKNEGLPLSILEAYFYNKPVYSTDVGNINEIICDYKYFINTNRDLDINEMKTSDHINMRPIIEDRFSLKNMSCEYLLAYKE